MANLTLQSILLNVSPLNSSRSLPSSPAFHASILPSDDDCNPTQSRKIRFAPLPVVPDPDCIQEDGQYDEFLDPEITVSIPSTPTPVPPPPLPPAVCLNPSTSSSSLQSLPMSKKSFSSKFIKPFFTPWSKSVSAPSSNDGSPPLSRVSSIESSQSLRLGAPLDRWTSAGSVRSFVSDSGRPQSRRHKASSSLSSSLNPLTYRSKSTPLPNKQYTPSAKPGMRMLNGRVYGRRRPYSQASTDPFANVRNTEPEFVEWGYGGMGSNKSNTNSSMGSAWRVVQNGSNSSAFGNDEDDSSGMAWVKKRRAEREKAKLEAEQKEQGHSAADVETPQPTIPEEEEQETPRLPTEDSVPHPPIDTPTVAPAEQPHEQPKHITTAVNLPPQRLHKRESSFGHRTQIPQAESSTKDKSPSGPDVFDMELDEAPAAAPETPEASSGSTSEEDEDSSSGGEDDEDESDVDSEEENAQSKTALGAGVEKVSRHKDVSQPKTPNLPHLPLKEQLPVSNTTTIEA